MDVEALDRINAYRMLHVIAFNRSTLLQLLLYYKSICVTCIQMA
jgi:hypothetical protein